MRSFKVLGPLALVLGLITAAPAAAGGDAGPPLYPSIVNVHLVRAQAALEHAIEFADTAQPDKAVAQLTLVRSQMRKAWTGAQYVIETAPPPVAGSGAVGRISGSPVGGSPYADQYTTAAAALTLQHDVAATAMDLFASAKTTLQTSLNTTIFAALNLRDSAIAYIKTKDVAPPAGSGSVARSSGTPVAAGWGPTMQGVVPQLDDEMQMIDGALKVGVTTGVSRAYRAAEFQDSKAERTINQLWPPLPAG
jgi:hypothetical protein